MAAYMRSSFRLHQSGHWRCARAPQALSYARAARETIGLAIGGKADRRDRQLRRRGPTVHIRSVGRSVPNGFRARRRSPSDFGNLAGSKVATSRFTSAGLTSSWLGKSVASKRMSGACSATPEQNTVLPLKNPLSFTTTSSSPNRVVGPDPYLLVTSVAVN